jgi:GNAT superfamily N-acetyltransferase
MISSSTWPAEEAAINGFPPLRQVVLGDWLLRFSDGVRRTANSATPLREPQGDFDGVIATAEALYAAQGQPAIFRIPSLIAPESDTALAARGYTAEGESCIIEGPIDAVAAAAAPFGGAEMVSLAARPTPEWLAAMARLQRQGSSFQEGYRRIVGSIALPAAFAALVVDGEPASLGYGVIHRGMVCFESIVTGEAFRRRGFSRRVLGAIADWAKRLGATTATLQVEASNTPGRTLYHAVGMTTELHRYHYRRQPNSAP